MNFVDLDPAVAVTVGVLGGDKIGFFEEVFEIEQAVGFFVLGVKAGQLGLALHGGKQGGGEEVAMDDKAGRHAGLLLAEGMLVVDYFGGKAGVVFGGVETGKICYYTFGIEVVYDGAVLGNFFLVEEVVGAETMDIAHKEVGRDGVVGALADAVAHAAAGTIGEGETYHVGIVDTVGMGMNDTLGKNESLATARRGQHKMAAATQVDDGLLVFVGATQLSRSWQGCAAGRRCGP